MATIFRDWSYQYQWLYDGISRTAALSVGGESRFRQLALKNLSLTPNTQVLDLCCGSGQTTRFLVNFSHHVTGLDASPLAIARSRSNVSAAQFVEGWAERMPFSDCEFDVVHTSAALHEMKPDQRHQIIQEVYRVLKPGGVFTLVDFHAPTNFLFWPGLALFLWIFETETAWEFVQTDLGTELEQAGFLAGDRALHAGGSLQVVQAYKPQS